MTLLVSAFLSAFPSPGTEVWSTQDPALFPISASTSLGRAELQKHYLIQCSSNACTQYISTPVLLPLPLDRVRRLPGMVLVMETVVLCHRKKESRWAAKEDKKWTHAPLARKECWSRRVSEM